MKYEWQPIREVFMVLAILFLGAGWWLLSRQHDGISPLAFLETSLVLVIAAEVYAIDR